MLNNVGSFDELKTVHDFDTQLRLAKDAAHQLFIIKKKVTKRTKKREPMDEQPPPVQEEPQQEKPDHEELDRFCQLLTYILCAIYAIGWEDAEDVVGTVEDDPGGDLNAVEREINGQNFIDRIYDCEDEDEVLRIIDTESNRDYNEGVYNAAEKSGKEVRKKWVTMRDALVRDTHSYLEGMEVGLEDLFYTYDGDSALYPGGFSKAENNVNCRCHIALVEVETD